MSAYLPGLQLPVRLLPLTTFWSSRSPQTERAAAAGQWMTAVCPPIGVPPACGLSVPGADRSSPPIRCEPGGHIQVFIHTGDIDINYI